ncbi:TetR family transcriptional regulator [Asticcacaulis taihuensis]|uniref:Transcriptional regulator, TetR family n=1 Tax=Asticcacaulis taihuensis TaxID=260084 RepID=A0A1G4PUK8_9CAUL|nr:TetR family transcriptional regulator [Asticcacaulis taihuensis]SCW36013.1 transcriptional regulator, TetR family [Asticcacaulis taihuensis]
MTEPASRRISSRKQPKQARSNELVSAILQAAVQVLAQEGAARFTTARVAERAGVSVGSLYQYFPNKAAILFRLQSEEWQQTTGLLSDMLGDNALAPFERLRALVRAFIQSECDEAAVRGALADAAPLYRDAPEAQAVRGAGEPLFERFIAEILPDLTAADRDRVAGMINTTMSAIGREFSEVPRAEAEISAQADALSDMVCAYLRSLGAQA